MKSINVLGIDITLDITTDGELTIDTADGINIDESMLDQLYEAVIVELIS